MKPLLILSPMREEMRIYAESLTHTSTLAGRLLLKGEIAGYPVAVCHTGMGLVNTTIAALAAITALAPCAVLSQGTAGAHTERLRVGDIVCADRFVFGDSRKGEEPLAVEVQGKMVSSLPAHPHFTALAARYGLALGTVMSGYAWNTDPCRLHECHETFGSLCEEMEDAAAAQVCWERGVPHGSLRVISNNHLRADGGYDLSSADILQHFIIKLIQRGELHL